MGRDRTSAAVAAPVRAALPAAWAAALREAWRALWVSRLVVWVAGVGAVAAFGLHDRNSEAFDPTGLTRPFGAIGDALVAPGARWDAVWFLRIVEDGYDPERAAFFPLYPVLVKAAAFVLGSPVVAGIAVSVAALLVGLTVLHRLVALDFGAEVAGLTVWLVAAFPAALFLSGVYSEALFLAVSVAAVYAARTGRWELAGAFGALATCTRSVGLALLVPLGLMFLRARREGTARAVDGLWLALVPVGLAVFCAFLALAGEDGMAPFHAQEAWGRAFGGPLGAVPDGASAAWDGLRDIVRGEPPVAAPYDPRWIDLGLFACLVASAVAVVGALRRLPAAYGLYALASLALPLSYPVDGQPLMSLPRFVAVLWPLHLWLALWLVGRRPAVRRAVLGASLAALALCSAEFSTWGWLA